MRISDRSSDVCSSDLVAVPLSGLEADRTRLLRPTFIFTARDFSVEIVATRSTAAAKLRQSIRSEEHTSELQSLMRISYAVFCLKKKKTTKYTNNQKEEEIQTKKYRKMKNIQR